MAIPLPVVEIARKPSWLKVKAPGGASFVQVRNLLHDLKLQRCPVRRVSDRTRPPARCTPDSIRASYSSTLCSAHRRIRDQ